MRVAISGGSVGGLFAAALLRQAGHDVDIFERSRTGLEGRGAGLVAQEEIFALLRAIDREEVAEVGVVASERITLGRSGKIIHRDPHPQMQISWDHLYLAIRSLVGDDAYHLGKAVVAAGESDGAAWLRFADGTHTEADLVIGADGVGSAVREAVIGNDVGARYAGYVAWRFLLPETMLPSTAAETLAGRFAFYHAEGSQTLGYLVAGPRGEVEAGRRRYNCVWYRRDQNLPLLLTDRSGKSHPFSLAPGQVPDAVREQLIADAQSMLPPPFAEVVEAEPDPFVQAIFDMDAASMVRGRLLLLGDAAFVARPHTAMGVAKAAGDAMTLARVLSQLSLSEALDVYDRERRRAGRLIGDYGRRLGAPLEPGR
jgi:2-polyprenyl-6-methoxyphenol hydroxylase-like FAD-dependent oxidoreductase